jgi:DnaK suppressor protein
MGLRAKLPNGARHSRIGELVVRARDLQRYKRLLLAKLDEVSAARDETLSVVPPAGDSEGDLMDRASADAEAELQVRLHRSDGRLLKAIEEALARIRVGTFGACETCKQPISRARLEAVPWARHCRDCKEREHP